jgi:hypothetical protein
MRIDRVLIVEDDRSTMRWSPNTLLEEAKQHPVYERPLSDAQSDGTQECRLGLIVFFGVWIHFDDNGLWIVLVHLAALSGEIRKSASFRRPISREMAVLRYVCESECAPELRPVARHAGRAVNGRDRNRVAPTPRRRAHRR